MLHRERAIFVQSRITNKWFVAKERNYSFAKDEPIVHRERAKFAQSRKTNLKMKFKKTLPTKLIQILWIRVIIVLNVYTITQTYSK